MRTGALIAILSLNSTQDPSDGGHSFTTFSNP